MNPDAPPPYTADERKAATFAEVAKRVVESTDSPEVLEEALEAFKHFLASQENVTLSKNQLKVLKSQGVLVLEETAKFLRSGGDGSDILPKVASIFLTASENLESQTKWDVVIKERNGPDQLNSIISNAFESFESELRELLKGRDTESTANKEELQKAREEDQRRIAELHALVPQTSSGLNLANLVRESMNRELKIIGDRTISQPNQEPQTEAKKSLAVLTELTGTSLPPSTLLGREFVTIGNHAIHQGSSYDVFLGEYFTGEKIAIKVLRHRVDEETGKKMHQRFARQTVNWSSLRHDAILPFYGIGLVDSPVVPGEFQLYLVSPYMQNRDVKSYLKKYPKATLRARLQMILDVARGLYHMHEAVELGEAGHGIVHSALNVYNVLIKDSGRAVISGFGHAKIIKDFQESFTGDNSEYRYMGPELMQDEAHITYGTDIYAWAMTALEILTDVPPFGEKTKGPKIIQKVATGQKPDRSEHPKLELYASRDELWSILEQCWNPNPNNRPTADQVVQWLKPLLQLGKASQATEQRPPPPGRKSDELEEGESRKPSAQASPPPPPPPKP
ncbi:fibroblast growth factor receptor 2 [Ceratobasidium sp. AG-Ba]|nr:fibroblast growth factor receptor 2 [Ceratobasidium sp. AG-Ba]QRW11058.1 fibroblast growth factor receptor 2 [Ceratobasidium sp. AG-Ba]